MKSRALLLTGWVALAPFVPSSAFAAGTLAGAVGKLAAPLESIRFPVVGTVGNISLSSFPLINIKLPLLGKGIPLVSSLTVHDGVIILQSVSALQHSLPGLGALNVTLTKITAKLP